jgi:hypothetical protein
MFIYSPYRLILIEGSYMLPSGNLTWLLKMAIEIVDFPIKNGDFL